MKTHCDRCGNDCRYSEYFDFVAIGELTEVKDIWRVHGVSNVCKSCGDKANKFINYYGNKKVSDKLALRCYLQSGKVSSIVSSKAFNALTNAGYY